SLCIWCFSVVEMRPGEAGRVRVVTAGVPSGAWIYERKEDGWRMLAYGDGQRVRLISRRGVDHTARFARLAAAVAQLRARSLILDGEVCVFDLDLVSEFHLRDTGRAGLATPPVFIAGGYGIPC